MQKYSELTKNSFIFIILFDLQITFPLYIYNILEYNINNFIINTSDFLNKFVSISESKLMKVEQQINKLEILLALLDSKLDSIQWLSNNSNINNIK